MLQVESYTAHIKDPQYYPVVDFVAKYSMFQNKNKLICGSKLMRTTAVAMEIALEY